MHLLHPPASRTCSLPKQYTPCHQYTFTTTTNMETLVRFDSCSSTCPRAAEQNCSNSLAPLLSFWTEQKLKPASSQGWDPNQFITYQLGHSNYMYAPHHANSGAATWLTSVSLRLPEVVFSWHLLLSRYARSLHVDISCTQMSDSNLSSYSKSIFRSLLSKHLQRLNAFWLQT